MKSPYQVAKEIGVTPQAVYKRLTPELLNQLGKHIQLKENGKYLLDVVAEGFLKSQFNKVVQTPIEIAEPETIEPVEQNKTQKEGQVTSVHDREIDFLRARIEVLESELQVERKHSREQSDKIISLAEQITEQLAELSRNNQILLGAEQSKTNPVLLGQTKVDEPDGEPVASKQKFRFMDLLRKKG